MLLLSPFSAYCSPYLQVKATAGDTVEAMLLSLGLRNRGAGLQKGERQSQGCAFDGL